MSISIYNPKYAHSEHTALNNIHIPKGMVYMRTKTGYVFVSAKTILNKKSFIVSSIPIDESYTTQRYINSKSPIYKTLYDFAIRLNPSLIIDCKPTKQQLDSITPHSWLTAKYKQWH